MKNSFGISELKELMEIMEIKTISKLKEKFSQAKKENKSFKDFYNEQEKFIEKTKADSIDSIYANLGVRILFTYCAMNLRTDLLSSKDLKEISLALTNIAKEILEEAKKKEE